jgi:hypothetical protein
MAKPQLVSTNATPRSSERGALADVIARREAAKREIQSAQAAEEKAREYRYGIECELERAKADTELAVDVGAYVAAVATGDVCEQVKSVAVSGADIRQLENDYERWQLMEAACRERVKELENAALHIPVQSKIDAVIRAEADVRSLLADFEEMRAELDRRLSILTWLHSTQLVKDEDVPFVKDAISSCYQFTRDDSAVREWREAVKALENDADKGLPK